ncbi:3-demethylubiquinone-9 3-methyltransferase [Alcanivorax xiamenensis]|uniref:3-demethylubiquinone-9 3-methyltransferase n=1 Tax=Alcanivorax xiamenensis TaxID=1177156 RepID=A0ABQ6Y2V6_9GAMM|nr:3-demethylubiquinone-9 3-methyltransferase [Alcanivorax xiamenensis]
MKSGETIINIELTIRPCLWFDGQAEHAAHFYVDVFPGSRITAMSHYGEAGKEIHGQNPGNVMVVALESQTRQGRCRARGGPALGQGVSVCEVSLSAGTGRRASNHPTITAVTATMVAPMRALVCRAWVKPARAPDSTRSATSGGSWRAVSRAPPRVSPAASARSAGSSDGRIFAMCAR